MRNFRIQLFTVLIALFAGASLACAAGSELSKGSDSGKSAATATADDTDANPPAGIVTAETVDRIVKAFEDAGFEVEVNKADSGAPLIESTDADNPFAIHFYDCTDGKQCGTIQLVSGWNMKNGVSAVTVEQWNSDKIWGQAYRDKDKDPWVAVTVDLRGGVTEANMQNIAERWKDLMSEYSDFVGWEKN